LFVRLHCVEEFELHALVPSELLCII